MVGLRVFLSVVLFLAVNCQAENPFPKDSIKTNEVPTDSENEKNKIDYRLPMDGLKVFHYDLTISPNFDDFTFQGEVDIAINSGDKPRDSLVLHAKDLKIKGPATVKCGDITATGYYNYDEKRDFLSIGISDFGSIANKNCTLNLKYTGKINDQLRGFYRSSYVNEKNETVWLATTHFEPVGARQAFPCFDEPALKATFKITINHPETLGTVLSNTKENSEFDNPSVVSFEKTPPMSTYLVAFVVSDFKSVENKNDKSFKVWARPNAYQNGEFAANIGRELLTHLEEFTGISLPISKMDQIAIPDFAAGAMENWGLVTYRESSLLYNNSTTTSFAKQNIASTIAHEFAHQWFGDLVGPVWWKYVWLNEGFANFFQYYIMNKARPDWRAVEQQVVTATQFSAFIFDSTHNSHPLNYDVQSPKEISNVFDKIIYQKGGSVIRMIQHVLTEPVFQKGLQNYLKTNKYQAADSDALIAGWNSAIEDKKLDLKTKLDNWLNKAGYPVVTVTVNDDGNVTLTQEQFFAKKSEDKNDTNTEKVEWWVPINYATLSRPNNQTTPTAWLEPSKNLTFNINASDWILVNIEQTGYYRVDYDEKNWNRIIKYLKSSDRENIHVLNRAQLISDALAFAKEGRMSHKTLMDLSSYLTEETDYIAWYPGYKVLAYLNQKFAKNKVYEEFKDYARDLIANVSKSVGFNKKENETDHVTVFNRIYAQNWACKLGQKECREKAKEMFNNWLNPEDSKPVPDPDMRGVVLCHGLREANAETWNVTYMRYLSTTEPVEKQQIYDSLSCSSNIDILINFLDSTLRSDSKPQDITKAINNVIAYSENGADAALDFVIRRHVGLIIKGNGTNLLQYILENIGSMITTAEQLKKLQSFSDQSDIPNSVTESGITKSQENIEWIKKNENDVSDWIREYKKKGEKPDGNNGNVSRCTFLAALVTIVPFVIKNFLL